MQKGINTKRTSKARRFLLCALALTTMAGLLLTGCANNAAPSEGAQGQGNEPAPAGGVKHLIMAVDPDYETFDPGRAYEVYADLVLHSCYDTLLQFVGGDVENLVPCAAESYTVSDDKLTYTFQIKPGQKFASGNEVTAEDFKWSIERGINLKGNPSFLADSIESMETQGDYTLIFHMKQPDASFLTKLTYCMFAAVDRKTAEANGATNGADAASTDSAKTWFDYNSAGSGPYKIESFTPNSDVVMVRNENYSGAAPYYDKITVKTVTDTSAQVMSVQGGDIDIAVNVDVDQAKSLEGAEGITVHRARTATISYLLLNCSEEYGPIANDKVHQAIRYAIDYPGVLALATEGSTVPVGPFPEGFPGSLPANDPNAIRDLDKAKALMAEAGYADGFSVELYIPTINVLGVDFVTVGQKVQNDLKEIGIDVQIVAQDSAVAQEGYRTGTQSMGLRMWGPDYPDNGAQLAFLPGSVVGLRANWAAESNPELVELGKKAESTVDLEERTQIFQQIAQLMNEQSPFVTLIQHATQYVTRANITGAEYSNRYLFDLRSIAAE